MRLGVRGLGGEASSGSRGKEVVELGSSQGPDLSDMSETLTSSAGFTRHQKNSVIEINSILGQYLKIFELMPIDP